MVTFFFCFSSLTLESDPLSFCFFFFFPFFCETGSHYLVLLVLELAMQTKLAWNSEGSTCLCTLSIEIKHVTYHPWLDILFIFFFIFFFLFFFSIFFFFFFFFPFSFPFLSQQTAINLFTYVGQLSCVWWVMNS